MDPETAKIFLNKRVDLRFDDGFILEGKITAIDSNGLVFVTRQRTSYVAYSKVGSVILLED
jgi:hypothetical protein